MKNFFYFDFRTWWTLVRLVRREQNPARRRRQYRTMCVVVPAMALLHAVTFALDPIFFPSLRHTEVRQPVFVVGHARSGTTYLHRMMANDPQFSYVLLWEMFFPSLIEKKLLRTVLRWDQRLGGRLRRRIDRLDERLFSKSQSVHESGLFAPEEDEFLLTMSCASGFWVVQYPYVDELDFYYLDDRWPAAKRDRVMSFYKECLRRQLVLNGPDLTHLSKAPVHCGRVESLIRTFPDARFVVPVRNPYETIPSFLKLMQFAYSARKRSDSDIRASFRYFADSSYHYYQHPLAVLDAHPEVPSAIVDYSDLVTDPAGTMRRVYDEVGLEMGPEQQKALAGEKGREYRSGHTYSLEEFGLDADEIRTRLAPLFDRFGWESGNVD
ncbi:MAG: sulfotransferase [Actinomycetota bacterium]|uniref:Sulfotransferase n=1 Tax=Mycobacterium lentiflavum TaxID=141349 RepID=A0ABY3UZG3_MYCLN|nr:sulfotransferase [Mycobacterium lentiflavum]MEE3062867.1 sulfotransferase [Actinomycetota bacterium]ULP43771.1 sulfotransferase [Mycobacterium lentiflavum]